MQFSTCSTTCTANVKQTFHNSSSGDDAGSTCPEIGKTLEARHTATKLNVETVARSAAMASSAPAVCKSHLNGESADMHSAVQVETILQGEDGGGAGGEGRRLKFAAQEQKKLKLKRQKKDSVCVCVCLCVCLCVFVCVCVCVCVCGSDFASIKLLVSEPLSSCIWSVGYASSFGRGPVGELHGGPQSPRQAVSKRSKA